jgi:hypothetical protein
MTKGNTTNSIRDSLESPRKARSITVDHIAACLVNYVLVKRSFTCGIHETSVPKTGKPWTGETVRQIDEHDGHIHLMVERTAWGSNFELRFE